MALSVNLENAIKNFFSQLSAVNSYLPIKSNGNRYELYIYSLVHKALSANFKLIPQQLEAGTNKFVFKCSPTFINNSSYFSFGVKDGKNYELRNGVEVLGHAMHHEVDISVFNRDNYHFGDYPDRLELKLGLECKYYSSANALKGEIRKYLGAMSDLSTYSEMTKGPYKAGCIHFEHGFFRGFVTNINSSIRTDLQDFVQSYNLYPKFGVVAGSAEETNLNNSIIQFSLNW